MEIGERIKIRREELKMSQQELADKVGYKSRSSVNKIEMDGRGLPQPKIVAFAKALDTTPSYLMGWVTEDNVSEVTPLTSLKKLNESVYATDTEEIKPLLDALEVMLSKDATYDGAVISGGVKDYIKSTLDLVRKSVKLDV